MSSWSSKGSVVISWSQTYSDKDEKEGLSKVYASVPPALPLTFGSAFRVVVPAFGSRVYRESKGVDFAELLDEFGGNDYGHLAHGLLDAFIVDFGQGC